MIRAKILLFYAEPIQYDIQFFHLYFLNKPLPWPGKRDAHQLLFIKELVIPKFRNLNKITENLTA